MNFCYGILLFWCQNKPPKNRQKNTKKTKSNKNQKTNINKGVMPQRFYDFGAKETLKRPKKNI